MVVPFHAPATDIHEFRGLHDLVLSALDSGCWLAAFTYGGFSTQWEEQFFFGEGRREETGMFPRQ